MKNVFSVVLFLAAFQVLAQEDSSRQAKKKEITSRFYVALEAGACFPLADFGDRSFNNPKSGLALTGMSAKLRAGYVVSESFLVVADAVYFYNPLDAKSLLNYYTTSEQFYYYTGPKFKVNTNAWSVYGAMAGAAWRIDLDDTYCDLKAMAGLANGTYATSRLTITDGVTTEYGEDAADDDISVAVNLGISFHIKMTDRVAVSVAGDYFVTEFDFKNVTYTYSDGTVEQGDTYTQPVSVFQISAGLVFRF